MSGAQYGSNARGTQAGKAKGLGHISKKPAYAGNIKIEIE